MLKKTGLTLRARSSVSQSPQEWFEKWQGDNPNWDRGLSKEERQARIDWITERVKNGCIGLTAMMLGVEWPPENNCWKTREKANLAAREMEKACQCTGKDITGNRARVLVYGIRLQNFHKGEKYKKTKKGDPEDGDDVVFAPNGKADLSTWEPKKNRERGYTNFDFGYVAFGGQIVHANHGIFKPGEPGYRPGDPAEFYTSDIGYFDRKLEDFNQTVWCAACTKAPGK